MRGLRQLEGVEHTSFLSLLSNFLFAGEELINEFASLSLSRFSLLSPSPWL